MTCQCVRPCVSLTAVSHKTDVDSLLIALQMRTDVLKMEQKQKHLGVKNSADCNLKNYLRNFSYLNLENRLAISCKLSPHETICIKCQSLLSREIKEKQQIFLTHSNKPALTGIQCKGQKDRHTQSLRIKTSRTKTVPVDHYHSGRTINWQAE